MPARSFDTRIDIPVATRTEIVELLNARLADASDLHSQTKQAHWNVKGSDFIQLHELFDSLAGTVLGFVDLIAERATALGGEALGTVRMAAAASSLDEFPRDSYDGRTPSTPWLRHMPHLGAPSEPLPRPLMPPVIRTPTTSSWRSAGASIRVCGSSKHTFRRADRRSYNQPRLRKRITRTMPTVAIRPRTAGYPQVHESSGMRVKFIP
jgi:hypothetical protein